MKIDQVIPILNIQTPAAPTVQEDVAAKKLIAKNNTALDSFRSRFFPSRKSTGFWNRVYKTVSRPFNIFLPGNAIFKRYNVDPNTVHFFTSNDVQLSAEDKSFLQRNKRIILQKALESNEMAKKYESMKAVAFHDCRGAFTMLENGTWASAVNLELNHGKITTCAERPSFLGAFHKSMLNTPLKQFQQASPEELKKMADGMRSRLLILSDSDLRHYAESCPDCDSFLSDQKCFSPRTLFLSLGQDDKGLYSLRVQPLLQRLPLWETRVPSLISDPNKTISSLSIPSVSSKASHVLQKKPWLVPHLIKSMESAKQAYEQNKTADISKINRAATVLVSAKTDDSSAPKITANTATKFDWKRRWHEVPELFAAANGYQEAKQLNPDAFIRLEAVSFYGQDGDVPLPSHLGRLAQGTRGGMDLLVLKIENDCLQIRTAEEFVPKIQMNNGNPGSSTLKWVGAGL